METITLSATIMGQPVSAQTTATVTNVAPIPNLVLTNTNNPLGGPEWQVSGAIQDASMNDKHTVTIDWGDGSPPTVISNLSTNQQFTANPPHRYAPRQLHEQVPLPYPLSVTVVDDDTGSAGWSDSVPAYIFDLDNDADNSWLIEPSDDPMEDVAPGRFVFANWDDDQPNGIRDLDEAPVSGEDDLEPFLVGWVPRPGFDYTLWHLTLHAIEPSVSGKIWWTPDKSGVGLPFVGSGEVIVDWTLSTQSVLETLYVEANGPGEIWLELRLWTPNYGTVVEDDRVVFTALEPDAEVNLIIHDGLVEPYGGKEARDDRAVTVANKNDTDADSTGGVHTPDSEDDDVREMRTGDDKHGRDEVDLMKLIAKKPKGYAGGPVTIEVTPAGGRVKLWKFSTKQELVDGFDAATGKVTFTTWVGGDKTMWVEITTPSQEVDDVQIKMTYGANSDTVKATAVWATVNRDYFETKDWEDVPESPWKDEMEENLQDSVNKVGGGTGVRPIKENDEAGEAEIYNIMLMEFTVTPVAVTEAFPRVKFDITRQAKGRGWSTTFTDPNPKKVEAIWVNLPQLWEESNDEPNDDDESEGPNSNGHMYVFDAPGVTVADPPTSRNKMWIEQTFFEFLRVSFGTPPEGVGVKGGQCSANIGWHSLITIQWDAFNLKWARVMPNEIKRGFLTIDDLPP